MVRRVLFSIALISSVNSSILVEEDDELLQVHTRQHSEHVLNNSSHNCSCVQDWVDLGGCETGSEPEEECICGQNPWTYCTIDEQEALKELEAKQLAEALIPPEDPGQAALQHQAALQQVTTPKYRFSAGDWTLLKGGLVPGHSTIWWAEAVKPVWHSKSDWHRMTGDPGYIKWHDEVVFIANHYHHDVHSGCFHAYYGYSHQHDQLRQKFKFYSCSPLSFGHPCRIRLNDNRHGQCYLGVDTWNGRTACCRSDGEPWWFKKFVVTS